MPTVPTDRKLRARSIVLLLVSFVHRIVSTVLGEPAPSPLRARVQPRLRPGPRR